MTHPAGRLDLGRFRAAAMPLSDVTPLAMQCFDRATPARPVARRRPRRGPPGAVPRAGRIAQTSSLCPTSRARTLVSVDADRRSHHPDRDRGAGDGAGAGAQEAQAAPGTLRTTPQLGVGRRPGGSGGAESGGGVVAVPGSRP